MHIPKSHAFYILALLASVSFGAPAHKHPKAEAPPAPKADESPTNLSLRVTALQTLLDLQPTPQQLTSLRHLAGSTADTRQRETNTASAKYIQTLQELHAALVQKDDDKIDALSDQLDQAADADHVDLDDDVTITDVARQKASEALKLFSASQLANFIAANQDDIEDPAAVLTKAIEAHDQKGDDWADIRDSAAEDIAALTAGVDQRAAEDVTKKVKEYLDKAHGVAEDKIRSKERNVPAEVSKLVGDIDPVQMIKNWAENEMARLLSNPQLSIAIDQRSK